MAKRTLSEKLRGGINRLISSCARIAFPVSLRIKLNRVRGIQIGENTFIGKYVYIDDNNPALVTIGNNVGIAMGVTILTHRRDVGNYSIEKGFNDYPFLELPVRIENNCQIGTNAILLPGVTIGKASIIGAGAVVNKDIPPYSLAVGVPAKVIKILAK